MKNHLIAIAIVVAAAITCNTVMAEEAGGKKLGRESGKVPRALKGEQTPVSDDIKATVASILSQYDSNNLTEADAKAINEAFRAAGIRRGPEQKEAIEAAGFDPQKISSLDPPPERRMDADTTPNRNEKSK